MATRVAPSKRKLLALSGPAVEDRLLLTKAKVHMISRTLQIDSYSHEPEPDAQPPEKERLQSPEERDALNGLYECILRASCFMRHCTFVNRVGACPKGLNLTRAIGKIKDMMIRRAA